MSGRRRTVVKYHKPVRLNIGVIVFSIIFIYIVLVFFTYMHKEQITIYEVIEKSIADDNTLKGVILRNETIYKAAEAGYVNYYVGEGEKIGKNSTVYSIDESGSVYELLSGTMVKNDITEENSAKFRNDIASFKKTYSDSNFGLVAGDFSYDITNTTLELNNEYMLSNLNKYLKNNKSTTAFNVEKAPDSGIVSYFMDGMERLTVNQITNETFSVAEDNRKQLRSTSAIDAGTPVYKLVTDEAWSIVIPLSQKLYEKISEKNNASIQVKFPSEDITTVAVVSTYKKLGKAYAKLDLSNYLVRFIDRRFVEVELCLNSAEGLKIPVSSIIKKKFYKVPLEYFVEDEDTGKTGVMKRIFSKNGNKKNVFVPTIIYNQDEKFGYVDVSLFTEGEILYLDKKNETYHLKDAETLEGAYNVNKGYCVFRRIEKLYENEEYCIIKKDTTYGLSAYDHIVVNANNVNEQEIIY